MGRSPCCVKEGLNKGTWTAMEDRRLVEYVMKHGEGKWSNLPKEAGIKRCGKSCRLRWLNYLRPDIKRGNISPDEEDLIIRLHRLLGNKWSLIAGRIPGRTDNEIKNYWNTNLSKKVGSDKNNTKQQKQMFTQSPIEKDKEEKDLWTLEEGELDMDFNVDELLNFTVSGSNGNSHVNIVSGASSSSADDQRNGSAGICIEQDLPLHGEIMQHEEFNDFTLLFEPDWLLNGDAWGCLDNGLN